MCCDVLCVAGHMGFLPWKDRYYNMLLEQLAMGEAVKGVKAAERERKSKAAAGQAAVGAGSLMVSLVLLTNVPLLAVLMWFSMHALTADMRAALAVAWRLLAHKPHHSLRRALLTRAANCALRL